MSEYQVTRESDGAFNVYSRCGIWLGWANALGVVQSIGGFDLRLYTVVAREVAKVMGGFQVLTATEGK